MGKICCVMGKSATGKDTFYNALLADAKIPFKKIVLYTTRPIREGETDGVDYFFIDAAKLDELTKEGKVIEARHYNTVYGIWSYATVDDGQMEGEDNFLTIGTLESFVALREYYGSERVIPIYLEIDDGIRLTRALEREKSQKEPKYKEMCRRFLADCDDFSEEKINAAGITRRFEIPDVDTAMRSVTEYLKGVL